MMRRIIAQVCNSMTRLSPTMTITTTDYWRYRYNYYNWRYNYHTIIIIILLTVMVITITMTPACCNLLELLWHYEQWKRRWGRRLRGCVWLSVCVSLSHVWVLELPSSGYQFGMIFSSGQWSASSRCGGAQGPQDLKVLRRYKWRKALPEVSDDLRGLCVRC